jgi:uncharacterized membrane protein
MAEEEPERSVAPKAARRNISRIAQLESSFEERRTKVDRVVSRIANWTGSLSFVALHLFWFAIWIVLNVTSVLPVKKFDPYPFVLLSVAVSCEAVLLSTVVLIKQNWMSRRDERRDQLHLQINLLAEQETTKILYLQRLICVRLGIREGELDPEIADLSQETAVEHLAEELTGDNSEA